MFNTNSFTVSESWQGDDNRIEKKRFNWRRIKMFDVGKRINKYTC